MLFEPPWGDNRLRPSAVASLWLLVFWCAACGPAPRPRAPAVAVEARPWAREQRIENEPLAPAVWGEPEPPSPTTEPESELPPEPPRPEPAPVAAEGEVLVYRAGEPIELSARSEAEAQGLFVLDVGSDWVPALFRSTPELPHRYEQVFIELANGRFGETPEGWRAAQERYLEPHGIPPSLTLLERRFTALADRACSGELDLQPLREFAGATWDEGAQAPAVPEAVVAALQARLVCEQHLRVPPSGVLDKDTRSALEELERRNRIYGRGSLQGETLEALRTEPLELERRTLLRVLTERVVLDLGLIEDGSALDAVPANGPRQRVQSAPDVVHAVEQHLLEAFGLQTVAGAQQFYRRLEGVLELPHSGIAIDPMELPSYYGKDMELWVEIDRGDLYYEFPFDEAGKPLDLRIERGPTMTLFTQEGGRVRPLVLYPTTIGGWRVRRSNGKVYWQYKESTPGTRAWKRIVTAPVWLPPPSTPSETLVATFRRTSDGSEFHALNQNLIGPSFASAYGLVAAYHQRVTRDRDGELELGKDDGMRTHGSSDYTSIWRTVSSGCHRLHNHLAMRLLSFVLAHREHRRIGHMPTSYRLRVSTKGFEDLIDVERTGYEFRLERPLEVQVLPGRVRGAQKRALNRRFPAADDGSAWPTLLLTPTGPAREPTK